MLRWKTNKITISIQLHTAQQDAYTNSPQIAQSAYTTSDYDVTQFSITYLTQHRQKPVS